MKDALENALVKADFGILCSSGFLLCLRYSGGDWGKLKGGSGFECS